MANDRPRDVKYEEDVVDQPLLLRVMVPPSDTVPPPVSPVPAVTVTDEFCS